MLFIVSGIFWCPWPCRATVGPTDVLFYSVVSLIVGGIVGFYLGRRGRDRI